MAKPKTASAYEAELRRMIVSRTGDDMLPWLRPQVRATATNMVILDKVQAEILGLERLVTLTTGSTGQMKAEVSPLLPYYDKLQRTLIMQFEALGLNYKTMPSKVRESVATTDDEDQRLRDFYRTNTTTENNKQTT